MVVWFEFERKFDRSHALDTTVDPLLLESGLAFKESKSSSSSSTSNSQSPQQSTVRFIPPLPLLFRLLLQQLLATAATCDFSLDLSECGLTCVYSFSFSFSMLLLTLQEIVFNVSSTELFFYL